jgi:putative holliday junction resolvase
MMQSSEAKTSHILGIDYGKVRIGLAIADSETRIAFVLKTLENNKDFLPSLKTIVRDNSINKIVIGVPTYDNRENIEYDSEQFGKMLGKELGIEVEYQNEMFTTKMAHQNLVDKGTKNIKSQDDQEAAKIILQSWLDKR